ncbi:MAG: LacI family DNA-binding transcriptional regulator [Lawsonibacter sp.]|nr:LacI family DNA-binding transcriptional regulator [Lawsonibacter sp.]
MATLKELADRTGYSPAAISRILSGDPSLSVTPEARRKVLEEAGRLNYTATRSRRGRAPKGVLRVGIAEMLTPAQQLDDPYYLYLSGFFRQGCLDKKYTCLPLEPRGEGFLPPEGEKLEAIAAIGLFTPAQIEALAALSPNVVFLDSSPFESRFDSVVLGYELGISLALDHLIGLGHRHIGFIGPTYKLDDLRQQAPEVRRQLFLQQMQQRGLSETPLLLDCPMEAKAAAQEVRNLLGSGTPPPTAFLCANEESAIGALRALGEAGRSVPGYLSVVSFNDTPRSALVDPPLTSVSTHVEEMAHTALRLLRERAVLPGRAPVRTLPLKVVVPPSLTVRQSSGPARPM